MGDKVTKPSTTTWTETELQNFIAWVEAGQVGMISINLTELDTTAVPDIEAGSIVEIAGALYQFASDETPSGWGDISTDTQAYIKITTSGDTATPEFTTTAPTYDADLGGWYDGNDRYVARVYKDASGDAIEKTVYVQVTQSVRVSGDLDVGNEARIGGDIDIEGSVDVEGTSVEFTGSDQDRQIDFASDAQVLWDESADEFQVAKGVGSYEYITGGTQIRKIDRNSSGTPSRSFNVYKPITCYVTWDVSFGSDHDIAIQINQNGGWHEIEAFSRTGIEDESGAEYGIMLNPGAYRIYMDKHFSSGTSFFTLYITGAYGTDSLTKATS